MLIEAIQQSPQRFRPSIARNPQGQVLVVPRGAGQDSRRRVQVEDVGEQQPDVTAGDLALEVLGSALRYQVTLVEYRDPSAS